MKILIAGLLSLSLILALSACTDSAGGHANQTTTQASAPTTTTSLITTTASTTAQSSSVTTISATVTREQAINLALQAAGLSRDGVYDLEAELDRERNGLFWELDFETREHEYSYDIHAQTGAIAKVERERNN